MSSRGVPGRTLRRRFTLGSGPLKRRSDRVEFLVRVVLVLALLAALPAGLLVGAAAYTGTTAVARDEAATRSEVTATLLAGAADGDGLDGVDVPTPATWTTADGVEHTGEVDAPPGSAPGAPVDVWVDRAGLVTGRPLTADEMIGQSVVLGVLTVLLVVIAAMSAHLLALWVLERRRFRRWEAGWASVEPLWVSRFR